MAHRLIAYDLGADRFAIVLAPAHTKSFIEKLVGDPKTRQRANAIVKAMAQIAKLECALNMDITYGFRNPKPLPTNANNVVRFPAHAKNALES